MPGLSDSFLKICINLALYYVSFLPVVTINMINEWKKAEKNFSQNFVWSRATLREC